MRLVYLVAILMCSGLVVSAQIKRTTAADYNGAFQYAVSETNRAFPFVFKFEVKKLVNGKFVATESSVHERQSEGTARSKVMILENGVETSVIQISTGFGSVYCSRDGKNWIGPQKYECDYPRSVTHDSRKAETVKYSVETRTFDGQKHTIYREDMIYAARREDAKIAFKAKVVILDERGYFISIEEQEGTLSPVVVTSFRTQAWDFKTKFDRIQAPK